MLFLTILNKVGGNSLDNIKFYYSTIDADFIITIDQEENRVKFVDDKLLSIYHHSLQKIKHLVTKF